MTPVWILKWIEWIIQMIHFIHSILEYFLWMKFIFPARWVEIWNCFEWNSFNERVVICWNQRNKTGFYWHTHSHAYAAMVMIGFHSVYNIFVFECIWVKTSISLFVWVSMWIIQLDCLSIARCCCCRCRYCCCCRWFVIIVSRRYIIRICIVHVCSLRVRLYMYWMVLNERIKVCGVVCECAVCSVFALYTCCWCFGPKHGAWNPRNQNVWCSVQHCIRTRSVHKIKVYCCVCARDSSLWHFSWAFRRKRSNFFFNVYIFNAIKIKSTSKKEYHYFSIKVRIYCP